MEKLERSKFTRAGEVANERLIEAVLDPGGKDSNLRPTDYESRWNSSIELNLAW